jgi:signal transduction histidine kinase
VPPSIGIERPVSWRRLLAAGLTAAALAGLAGGVLEWRRSGSTDAAAAARLEAHVRGQFDELMASLGRVASDIATDPETARGLAASSDEARVLFNLVAASSARVGRNVDIAVTLYDVRADARAWVGRPSDIPATSDRIKGPAAFFLAQSPAGLRLVYVEPVTGPEGRRLGTVAAEHVVSPGGPAATIRPTDYTLATPLAPVSLRMRWEGAGDRAPDGAFTLMSPSGEPLAEASVAVGDLRAARLRLRNRVAGAVLVACGITAFLLIGPLLDRRAAAVAAPTIIRLSAVAAVLLAFGAILVRAGVWLAAGSRVPVAVDLMIFGGTAVALIALFAGPIAQLPLLYRGRRRPAGDSRIRFVAVQLLSGAVAALLIAGFARLLEAALDPASVDLRHFSLHPWGSTRILLLGGILALHIAILWTATLILAVAATPWSISKGTRRSRAWLLVLWVLPAAVIAALVVGMGWEFPVLGLLGSAAACSVAALAGRRVAVWYRHGTVASRIFGLFLAFLVPALLLYPSVNFFARRATERLITTRFAVEAQQHPETIQNRMAQARGEIDAIPVLPALVSDTAGGAVTADSAFLVWSQTVLARARLTSSIELYHRNGELLSRFALNLPEYTGASQKPAPRLPCEWDVFGEGAPFGTEERSMLHAERNICVQDGNGGPPEILGTIVVHVAFDYRTLPFITSQSPYFEIFRPAEDQAPSEGSPGSDVDVAIYGWSRRPIYTSDRSAWPISDTLFEQIYASREPFWTSIQRGDQMWRVYITNDRPGIFAIGYPTLTVFDRLVHIAELTTLAGVACLLVLIGTLLFTRASRERPRVGRALLREIRASFYRKLFLAFVLASIIPVLTLALVIRAYFAELLWDDVQAAAARTAAVARRVIEGSDELLRGASGMAPVSDDVMIWISQVIDQDVNIFEGPRLTATSERDLFASGLLSTRTPDAVYRAIAIDRLPSFVDEDTIGAFRYMIAATPVRAGGRDAILTVPLTTRQREIEREIDELDRGVHLAALFFILLGAGIGLSLAERIADPVRRLTLATRRIAGGDFDARIAVRSADELKRLVDAFNSMAEELKRQRAQLERTHRLEAWAEMARQVAHEIKNPLTPIQLSAEHLRRVHADRGEPMGPVLESCVSSILSQVKLLRQISGEFSNFASSPTARRAEVDVPELIAEVVEPYRTGLADRIAIDNRVAAPLPRVFVDRTLIARALGNIVENALHAMPGRGTLTIEAEADDRFVTVRVRDTGKGMDEEALARVFEPYFSTKTTGTGLGLPIARRNVEISGGTIEVESARGQGTVVVMRLPVAADGAAIRPEFSPH